MRSNCVLSELSLLPSIYRSKVSLNAQVIFIECRATSVLDSRFLELEIQCSTTDKAGLSKWQYAPISSPTSAFFLPSCDQVSSFQHGEDLE